MNARLRAKLARPRSRHGVVESAEMEFDTHRFFSANAANEPRANGLAVCESGAHRARTPFAC
jgi:hypothetical protein